MAARPMNRVGLREVVRHRGLAKIDRRKSWGRRHQVVEMGRAAPPVSDDKCRGMRKLVAGDFLGENQPFHDGERLAGENGEVTFGALTFGSIRKISVPGKVSLPVFQITPGEGVKMGRGLIHGPFQCPAITHCRERRMRIGFVKARVGPGI